jgi:hypothetical protein
MEYVNAEIATLPPRSNPRVTSAEFTRARALAAKEKTYTAKEVEAGAWRQTGKYALLPGGPAQVIPSTVSASAAQGTAVARLSKASLGLNDRMVSYQGSGFSMSYPSSWQKGEGKNGSVAFVPPNGAGQAGIAYGAIIDGAKFRTAVRDASTLTQATTAIARQMSEQNGGLQQASDIATLTVGGQPANAIELRGRSPAADGGSALAERDLLVTVARPDGAVSFMVFVAPEQDYEVLKPLFSSMIQSFKVR